MASDDELRVMRSKEVAAVLGVSMSTLAKWRGKGNGPRYVKIGSQVRYRAVDVGEYIAIRGPGRGRLARLPHPHDGEGRTAGSSA